MCRTSWNTKIEDNSSRVCFHSHRVTDRPDPGVYSRLHSAACNDKAGQQKENVVVVVVVSSQKVTNQYKLYLCQCRTAWPLPEPEIDSLMSDRSVRVRTPTKSEKVTNENIKTEKHPVLSVLMKKKKSKIKNKIIQILLFFSVGGLPCPHLVTAESGSRGSWSKP